AKPERVHREVNAPLKQSSCLHCGGRLSSPRIEQQYQIDIPPVEPVVTQFNRAIRPAAIVRKTSGGNRSQAGAKTHAIITSLWQRCRQQGRNFLAVVTELLRQPVPQPIFLVPPAPTGVSSKAPPAPLT
ncbi:MAG: hypothetical protein ACE5G8_17995, partial [Anaerolineae bacterium]